MDAAKVFKPRNIVDSTFTRSVPQTSMFRNGKVLAEYGNSPDLLGRVVVYFIREGLYYPVKAVRNEEAARKVCDELFELADLAESLGKDLLDAIVDKYTVYKKDEIEDGYIYYRFTPKYSVSISHRELGADYNYFSVTTTDLTTSPEALIPLRLTWRISKEEFDTVLRRLNKKCEG